MPFSGTNIAMPVGVSTAAGETSTVEANFRTVTAGYFEALGIPLVSGAPAEAGTGVRQGVVSESFARRVGASVLGATLQLSPGEQGMFTVTGVVGDEGDWSVNGGSTIAACAVILVTAAVGALGPARQAARADPIRALSTD